MSVMPNSLKKKANPTESWGFSVLQTQRCLRCLEASSEQINSTDRQEKRTPGPPIHRRGLGE